MLQSQEEYADFSGNSENEQKCDRCTSHGFTNQDNSFHRAVISLGNSGGPGPPYNYYSYG